MPAPAGDGTAATPSVEADAAWRKEFKARLAARLAELGPCTRTLKAEGGMDVAFELRADGSVEKVRVPSTTLRDCRALECVRHGLSELKIPPLPWGVKSGTLTIHSVALPAAGADGTNRSGPTPHIAEGFDLDGAIQSCLTADDQGPHESTTDGPNEATRLPANQVQALVRQHYGAFRHCYDSGLGRNPRLHGRVAIAFVIDKQGRVKSSRIAQNDLPDCDVARCVRDEMRGIQFPAPRGGVVAVTYPIVLEPG